MAFFFFDRVIFVLRENARAQNTTLFWTIKKKKWKKCALFRIYEERNELASASQWSNAFRCSGMNVGSTPLKEIEGIHHFISFFFFLSRRGRREKITRCIGCCFMTNMIDAGPITRATNFSEKIMRHYLFFLCLRRHTAVCLTKNNK